MRPPTTYAEWISLLEIGGSQPLSDELLDSLRHGVLNGSASSACQLMDRIVEFENAALRRRLSALERSLAMLPAGATADDTFMLIDRFSRDCDTLVFFREMQFLPAESVQSLCDAIANEVARVLGEFIRHIDREHVGGTEDLVYRVRRLRTVWLGGGTVGQLQ